MWEIVTRADARRLGHTSYYTGKPCKNGHDDMRYTQSGTCKTCVRQSNRPLDDLAALSRQSAKRELIRAKFRLYDIDRETFSSTVWSLALLRYPTILQSDVDPKVFGTDRDANTGLYAYDLHPDDFPVLREVANALLASHAPVQQIAETKRLLFVNWVPK